MRSTMSRVVKATRTGRGLSTVGRRALFSLPAAIYPPPETLVYARGRGYLLTRTLPQGCGAAAPDTGADGLSPHADPLSPRRSGGDLDISVRADPRSRPVPILHCPN